MSALWMPGRELWVPGLRGGTPRVPRWLRDWWAMATGAAGCTGPTKGAQGCAGGTGFKGTCDPCAIAVCASGTPGSKVQIVISGHSVCAIPTCFTPFGIGATDVKVVSGPASIDGIYCCNYVASPSGIACLSSGINFGASACFYQAALPTPIGYNVWSSSNGSCSGSVTLTSQVDTLLIGFCVNFGTSPSTYFVRVIAYDSTNACLNVGGFLKPIMAFHGFRSYTPQGTKIDCTTDTMSNFGTSCGDNGIGSLFVGKNGNSTWIANGC